MSLLNRDFSKSPVQGDPHPRLRWVLLALGSVVLGVVIASSQSENPQALPDSVDISAAVEELTQKSYSLTLPELQSSQDILDQVKNEPPQTWRELKVKRGNSLSVLFDRAHIKPDQVAEILQLGSVARPLLRIYPGDTIRVLTDSNNILQALHYEMSADKYLLIQREQGLLKAEQHKHNVETRVRHARGTINNSMFLAAQRAGISQNIIMELAGIFGWDIDFVLDIRKGDTFTLIYEELFRDGEKVRDGNILAAEFINNGKTYRAVRYTNPASGKTEYYSDEGRNLRKAFLRSPVDFTRISSGFTNRRYHPLLHKFRAHKGVDYAARRGSPVHASGDGRVTYKGRKGGYGRVVIINHGTRYSTLYAHLNSYSKKIRKGRRVTQGQTIGFVGSSGLATGPHLHYEFRVNGVHRNPLRVKFPDVKPIPSRHLADFELSTGPLLAQLDTLTRATRLALANQ